MRSQNNATRPTLPRQPLWWRRQPLFRLLAINLAAGVMVATLLLAGLLWLNPLHLRDLILADDSPGTALGLLLFGFVVTFGSAAMGTAIMAMGQERSGDGGTGRGRRIDARLVPAPVKLRHTTARSRVPR